MSEIGTERPNGSAYEPGGFELHGPQADEAVFARLYAAHGACIIRGLFAADGVAKLQTEAERLFSALERGEISRANVACRPAVNGGNVFERIDPLGRYSPLARELVADPVLLRLAAAAVGGPPVLFKDKLIYKLPGDAGYGLHQDYPHMHECTMPPDAVTALMIAIDRASTENGCLRLWPGYHGSVLPAPPDRPHDVAVEALDPARRCDVRLEAGDAVFFHVLTPHDSGPNVTAAPRRTLFFMYTRAQYADQRDTYYRAREAVGPGGGRREDRKSVSE